jgi:hypothetical protein
MKDLTTGFSRRIFTPGSDDGLVQNTLARRSKYSNLNPENPLNLQILAIFGERLYP